MLTSPSHDLERSISEHIRFDWMGRSTVSKFTGHWLVADAMVAFRPGPGGGEVELESDRYRLGIGQILIIPEFTLYRLSSNKPWTVDRFRIRVFKTVDLGRMMPCPLILDWSDYRHRLDDQPAGLSGAVAQQAEGLTLAARLLLAAGDDIWEADTMRHLGRMAPVLELVERAYHMPLTRADLASAAGLAQSRFNAVFTAALRVSPMTWLRNYRLQRAKVMLMLGQGGVAEVAEACGFGDPFHFSRSFRAKYGISPSSVC